MKTLAAMSEQIHTAQELVAALGGVTKAAEQLGEKYPSTISNWLRAGRIPAAKFLKHKSTLDELGVTASSTIWFGSASVVAQ